MMMMLRCRHFAVPFVLYIVFSFFTTTSDGFVPIVDQKAATFVGTRSTLPGTRTRTRTTTTTTIRDQQPQKTPSGIVEDQLKIVRSNRLTILFAASGHDSITQYPISPRTPERIQHRDVVIVGNGLAGLSAALYLTQMDPSRHVTILDRLDSSTSRGQTSAGSFAAAGMLAPQSERLPKGPLLDLCLESRRMFADYCDLVERLARESGKEGRQYFQSEHEERKRKINEKNEKNLDPWDVGYLATGGFLAPAFAGDTVATWAPPDDSGSAVWLDSTQVRELEPNLHPDVVGGWWFPEDASVDALRLLCSLRAACVQAGVQILSGPEYEITSLDLHDNVCRGLWVQKGHYIATKSVLLANGAWMRDLLPVPIEPHKGQSLSLRMPADRPPILRRVMFAQDSYIVPKADGTIVIGATVEAGSYDPNVTPAGILHILTHALQLLPALKDLPIVETWAGLRPTTPDKGPILGKTRWDNLYLAGGYWRNGVLLAPKAGQLVAALIAGRELNEKDADLLKAFSWDRFTDKSSGIALAANSRYAASMHPVQRRTSGFGVAASVGTELGSYSSARSAADERKRDRHALFGNTDDMDEALERAASLGKLDSTAYVFGKGQNKNQVSAATGPSFVESGSSDADDTQTKEIDTMPFEGSADAWTVGSASSIDERENLSTTPLEEVYKTIQKNKEKRSAQMSAEVSSQQEQDEDKRPDPGFRVFHVDTETGEERVVPPYTSPGEFLKSIEIEKASDKDDDAQQSKTFADTAEPNGVKSSITSEATEVINGSRAVEGYSEKTYDGYQDIQQANSRMTREEELKAMRAARMKNRLGQSSIDVSKIGVRPLKDD